MIKIEREILENLGFDLDAELERFSKEKEQHHLTVDVPAPTSHPLVMEAFASGGYEVVDSREPLEPPPPAPPEEQPVQPDPRKAEALERLQKLKGQKADFQLEEIRGLLAAILEMLPG
jgi:hypothetical protein